MKCKQPRNETVEWYHEIAWVVGIATVAVLTHTEIVRYTNLIKISSWSNASVWCVFALGRKGACLYNVANDSK